MTLLRLFLALILAAPLTLLPPAASADQAGLAAAKAAVPSGWRFPLDAKPAEARHGMVASDAPLATQAGVEVLKAGGNAVDAAVATAFALAVVLPEAGNIGGGGFLVVHRRDGTSAALDFRETAPLAATRDMFLDDQGNPTDRSLTGALAVGVPGTVAGLWRVHERFGHLPWAQLVAPAIRLAEKGFPVGEDFADWVHRERDRLALFPGSAALFLPNGQPLRQGQKWRNPDLAKTLRRIAENGAEGFYEGRTAELLVAEMQRDKGIISREDLKHYRAEWRKPVSFEYCGHTVVTMPPPSSGGVTLALILHMLKLQHWRAYPWHSPDSLQLSIEAMRRAFAVRNARLADPDFIEVPMQELMSMDYARKLGASIDMKHATPSHDVDLRYGSSGEGMHTTHFSVADKDGMAVALTTTVNTVSGVTVSGAGFLLNNEMDDFAAKPGTPNVFGLVQGEANAVAPDKRPLSSMTPTIVVDADGWPRLVTGASGGPTIITSVFQILTNVIDQGMPIGAAVNAPRLHHQHLPDTVFIERGGFPKTTLDALRARGDRIKIDRWIGPGASIERRNGRWYGMADPRIAGEAAGY